MDSGKNFQTELPQMKSYWSAVCECLVQFHHQSPQEAKAAVEQYQQDILVAMSDPSLVYHEEPFHLANEIADEDIALSGHREAYSRVLQRAG